MSDLLSRHALEADLTHQQQANDFAAQAETLMALARLAEDDEAESLAQGLYAQAWAAAQHANHTDHIIQAMRGIGRVMTGAALLEERRANGINLDRWFYDLLALALEAGSRWNQAETYLAMGHWGERNGRGPWITLNFFVWGYAIYQITGRIPDTVLTPRLLSETRHNIARAAQARHPFFLLKERLFKQHQERGDHIAEAHGWLAYGEMAFWNKDYLTAREDFERALLLFQQLDDHDHCREVLLRLSRLARRTQDYDLYKQLQARLVFHLAAQGKFEEIMALWMELALMAADYLDWPLVRHAYQAALMAALRLQAPEKQAYIYWQWGQMEFYKTHRRTMGLALCRWSLTLHQHYLPDQTGNYARELRQMEKEAAL